MPAIYIMRKPVVRAISHRFACSVPPNLLSKLRMKKHRAAPDGAGLPEISHNTKERQTHPRRAIRNHRSRARLRLRRPVKTFFFMNIVHSEAGSGKKVVFDLRHQLGPLGRRTLCRVPTVAKSFALIVICDGGPPGHAHGCAKAR